MSARKKSDETKEKQKQNIINAAINEFSAQGYSKTTVESIAKKAKIAKGLVYYYFKDKDALFVESINFIRQQMIKYIEKNIPKDIDAFERLRLRTKNTLEFFSKNREKFIIFSQQGHVKKHKESDMKKEIKHFLEHINKLKEGFDNAVKENLLPRDSDTDSLALMLFSIVNIFMSYSILTGKKLDHKKAMKEIDQYFLSNLKIKRSSK